MADVNESNVYVVTQGRKLYGMPTDFGFCVKVRAADWAGLRGVRAAQVSVSYLWLLSATLRDPASSPYT